MSTSTVERDPRVQQMIDNPEAYFEEARKLAYEEAREAARQEAHLRKQRRRAGRKSA